jgi:hypothetical protein
MKLKFDVIDTFSRRPALAPLALKALREGLKAQFPDLEIDPQIAVITRTSNAGKPKSETLMEYLRQSFSSGKTLHLKSNQNTLIADPSAPLPAAVEIDVAQLAIVIDSVSLGLVGRFMQSVVTFWDSPGEEGTTPWKSLSQALAQQSANQASVATVGSATETGPIATDFEQQALDVLEAQLSQIQDVLALGLGDFDEIERYLAKVTDVTGLLGDTSSAKVAPRLNRLDQLPDWLRHASAEDRLDYSRTLAALAVVGARAEGKSWDDDLPPILEYANKVLQDGLREDHPEATALTFNDVTVHIAKVTAAAVPSGGQIVTVGSVENIKMSVAAFALDNLSSLPNGTLTLSLRDGGPLPTWLTPDYLKQLVSRVDIGRTYPALVRRYLITDSAEATRRQTLFKDQLRVQLPLKALEQKIRGEGHLTQAGYRRVRSLLQPSTESAAAVLRPLAFVAEPGAPADPVSNMFVMGGADLAIGPFVLYRPFDEVPLTEFSSWSALREAVAHAGELQDQVLAWMSEHAAQLYANGGFAQPHLVRFGQGSEFAPLEVPVPAQLDVSPVPGDVFAALFNANARALADLADLESVSNAESRWALIKRGGWLALDAVMPFVSGSVGSALWLVQVMVSVDQVLAAERRKAKGEGVEAWNALLLTISMILLHHGFTARVELSRRPLSLKSAGGGPGSQTDLPMGEQIDLPPGATTLVDFSWSSVSHHLTKAQTESLERLKVLPEPVLEASSAQPGTEGLFHQDQRWFVRLDTGVYEVAVDEGGVSIVNAGIPSAGGPRLRRVNQAWTLDLSLRLRGGGPKRNVRQLALENAATLKRVTEAKLVLDQRRHALYQKFVDWDAAFRATPEQLPADLITRVETDLKEISAIFEQKKQLDLELRPADRAADKTVGNDLRGVCRRIAFFEGLLLETVLKQARTQMIQLQTVSDTSVTQANVTVYLKLFEDLLALQSQGVHWSGVREGLWRELRTVPKVGEGFWRDDVLELHRSNLFTHMDWRINRLWSLLELTFSENEILSGQSAKELKDLRTDEGLHAAFSSHAELEKPNDYTPAEQISVLESSLREYQRGTLIATYAHESAPDAMAPAYFSRFLEELSWISDRAEHRLSALIRESAEPPAQPSEYAPRLKQPRRRVFKTRAQRTLIGRVREGESDLPGVVLDVTQAAGDTVIGTYHLHENGEWVEVKVVPAAKPMRGETAVALAELTRQATAGLARIEPDISTVRRQSVRISEPEDMQDILVQKAEKLSALADKLGAHLAGSPQSEDPGSTLQALIDQLRSGAARLVEEGRTVRVAMIKNQPPTAARLSYLAREREVNIARFDGRKNMSGAKRNDFLQEYVIRDKDQRVLWWAHFHYAGEATAADAFTAAHLKMPEQRFIGYKALVKAAKDDGAVVTVYRSAIGKDVAQRLFIGLAP